MTPTRGCTGGVGNYTADLSVLKSLAPKGPKALDGAQRSRPTEQQRIAACLPTCPSGCLLACLPACLPACPPGWLVGWLAGLLANRLTVSLIALADAHSITQLCRYVHACA
jgi:hypothetical protein